jgi:hypothetical protein
MLMNVNRRGETLGEFAASFGLSYDTVWRHAKSGALKTILLGKRKIVPRAEIERVAREGLRARP